MLAETGRSTEIEITPEMIEAGVDELHKFNPAYERYEDGVMRIVSAVMGAKFQSSFGHTQSRF